jgi:hypothetical protein
MRKILIILILNSCFSISYGQFNDRTTDLKKNLFPSAFRSSITGFSLPADHYATQLGFFCKKEWALEKRMGMPLRFRIGELAQLNKWEGKRY